MNRSIHFRAFYIIIACASLSFILPKRERRIFLVGDSTVADYSIDSGYLKKRYPLSGWGQQFQAFFVKDSLMKLKSWIRADSIEIRNFARGGRSTRTFFEEGRWATVMDQVRSGDVVLIQFGHNDAAQDRPDRYVDLEGYKSYLKRFVEETRSRNAIPVLISPVNRNYPWKDGKLANVHGAYPEAVKSIATALKVRFIDLTQISIQAFSAIGQEKVSREYFMNFEKGKFAGYPDGQKDNTHFQTAGAYFVAQLVFNELKK